MVAVSNGLLSVRGEDRDVITNQVQIGQERSSIVHGAESWKLAFAVGTHTFELRLRCDLQSRAAKQSLTHLHIFGGEGRDWLAAELYPSV